MDGDEIEILARLVAADGPTRAAHLARAVAWPGGFGARDSKVRHVCGKLRDADLVGQEWPNGPLHPTERGRVTLAIMMARDPRIEAARFGGEPGLAGTPARATGEGRGSEAHAAGVLDPGEAARHHRPEATRGTTWRD